MKKKKSLTSKAQCVTYTGDPFYKSNPFSWKIHWSKFSPKQVTNDVAELDLTELDAVKQHLASITQVRYWRNSILKIVIKLIGIELVLFALINQPISIVVSLYMFASMFLAPKVTRLIVPKKIDTASLNAFIAAVFLIFIMVLIFLSQYGFPYKKFSEDIYGSLMGFGSFITIITAISYNRKSKKFSHPGKYFRENKIETRKEEILWILENTSMQRQVEKIDQQIADLKVKKENILKKLKTRTEE